MFSTRLPLAVRFAELLCTAGVERGLVGPREPERIWPRHLLSSAALAPLLPADATVADLGSGAGLPGVPLALARPDLAVTLVEPMLRRVQFLDEAVSELGLPTAVVRARAQELTLGPFDVVVVRAVAPLGALLELALPHVRPGGRLLAVKGERAEIELAEAAGLVTRHRLGVSLDVLGEGEHTTRVVQLQRPPTTERTR